jgi:hypothetical protein
MTEMKTATGAASDDRNVAVNSQFFFKTMLMTALRAGNGGNEPVYALQRDVRDLLWDADETKNLSQYYSTAAVSKMLSPAGTREAADLRANAIKSLHYVVKQFTFIVPKYLRSLFRDACFGSRSTTTTNKPHIADLWNALRTFNTAAIVHLAKTKYNNIDYGAWRTVKELIVADDKNELGGLSFIIQVAQQIYQIFDDTLKSKEEQQRAAKELNNADKKKNKDNDSVGDAKKKELDDKKSKKPKAPKAPTPMIDTYAGIMRAFNQATIKSAKSNTIPLSATIVLLHRMQLLLANTFNTLNKHMRNTNASHSLTPVADVKHTIKHFRAPITPSIYKNCFSNMHKVEINGVKLDTVEALVSAAYTQVGIPFESIKAKGFLLNARSIAFYVRKGEQLTVIAQAQKPKSNAARPLATLRARPLHAAPNKKPAILTKSNTIDEIFKDNVINIKTIDQLKAALAGSPPGKLLNIDIETGKEDAIGKDGAVKKGLIDKDGKFTTSIDDVVKLVHETFGVGIDVGAVDVGKGNWYGIVHRNSNQKPDQKCVIEEVGCSHILPNFFFF